MTPPRFRDVEGLVPCLSRSSPAPILKFANSSIACGNKTPAVYAPIERRHDAVYPDSDPYQLKAELSSGDPGRILLATDTRLRRSVEIKTSYEVTEALNASRHHSYICTLHDVGVINHAAAQSSQAIDRYVSSGSHTQVPLLAGRYFNRSNLSKARECHRQ